MYTSLALTIVMISTVISTITAAAKPCPTVPQPYIAYTPPKASPLLPVHKLFNASGFGFENLYARANGQFLVTAAFPTARLWQLDPLSILPPIVLHEFPSFAGTTGITELAPDMFYMAAYNSTLGSSSIFSIDMRPFVAFPNGTISIPPLVKEVARLPSPASLNGMTHMRENDDFVLTAETTIGGVWKTNVKTGSSTLIIKNPTMLAPPNTTAVAAYGINGVRVQNSTLYYTNSGAQTLHRMPLHADGSSAGPAQLIASPIYGDDFAIDPWGFLYMASPGNALLRVNSRTGEQIVLAGTFNSTTSDIISASSVRFGRGVSDASSVYITTNGGSFTCAPPGSQGVSRVDVGDLAQIFG